MLAQQVFFPQKRIGYYSRFAMKVNKYLFFPQDRYFCVFLTGFCVCKSYNHNDYAKYWSKGIEISLFGGPYEKQTINIMFRDFRDAGW